MALGILNEQGVGIDASRDGIIIIDNFQSKRGGAVLSFTGFAATSLTAGHVIIRETATGDFKPMPVTGAAYDALPVGHTYEGILIQSLTAYRPFAGVMIRGTVNTVTAPYPFTPILTALKAALPLIDFRADV